MSPVVLLGVLWLAVAVGTSSTPDVEGTASSGARSQDPEDSAAASDLLRLAAQQYDEGKFDKALATLQAARSISARPSLLYNIGQVQRARHDCAGALEAYRGFLAATPASDPNHDRALKWQADMEACVAETTPAAAPGKTSLTVVSTPSSSAAAIPMTPPVLLAPSKTAGSPPASAESLHTTHAPPNAPPAAGRPSSPASLVGWSLLGAGAIAGGAALWYALEASRINNDFGSGMTQPVSRFMKGTDDNHRALWLGIAGGVLAAGGGTVLIVAGRAGGTAGPQVALVGWSGRF